MTTKTIKDILSSKGETSMSESSPIRYLDTVHAYDKWAETYDKDDNFLQALDTLEMQTLLPFFLDSVCTQFPSHEDRGRRRRRLKLFDLGCGTGRNTIQLLLNAPDNAEIIGLDVSSGMLGVAMENIRAVVANTNHGIIAERESGEEYDDEYDDDDDHEFHMRLSRGITLTLDLLDIPDWPFTPLFPSPFYRSRTGTVKAKPADTDNRAAGIISTLVLEHIELDTFFLCITAFLRPGGYLLLTNMHSEMGETSQASFFDEATGTKIRPETSYCHRLDDVLRVAKESGLDVVGDVRERAVDEGLVEVLGTRARKWVGVKVWVGVCFRKMMVPGSG